MAITLTFQGETINLHPDLKWADEHDWHPVEQSIQRTITGALIVSSAARTGGRPVTLQPEDEDTAWMTAETLAKLRNFAVVPGRVMQLTLRGVVRSVIFRHHDNNAIEANPVVFYNDVSNADWYRITLKLMEI
jgi:hypothetical protein